MPQKKIDHDVAEPVAGIATEATSEPKAERGTVGALVKQLLQDASLTYVEIVARVMAVHPQASTSTRSVASTAAVLRKGGEEVPMRRIRKTA